MAEYFTLILVGLSSGVAYLIGVNAQGRSPAALRAAMGKMLECLGVTVVFFGINLAAGMVIALMGRLVTRQFVSLYLANDISLLVLSFLQGLVFQCWRDLSAGGGARAH